MNLIVISGGDELNVSGLNEDTTCMQVVYALAHATNQKGKFVLVAHLDGHEHRLSQSEKPLDVVNQFKEEGVSVMFELRHLDQDASSTNELSSPETGVANHIHHAPFVSASHSHFIPISRANVHLSENEESIKKASSLPPGGFKMEQRSARPPPPAYRDVIGQRYNSLSRDISRNAIATFSRLQSGVDPLSISTALSQADLSLADDFGRFSRQDLERIIHQQGQYIAQQKAQLVNLDVTMANTSERELVQLKKQHNNLLTVLNSLRNANWSLRLKREQQEADRLQRAIDEMKTFVDVQKTELMKVAQLQDNLEKELDFVYSNSDTASLSDETSQTMPVSNFVYS